MRLNAPSLPIDHLSATSLSAFASCPEQWRRKYLQKEPDFHSGDRFMGSVNHDSIACLLNLRRQGEVVETWEFEKRTAWVREVYRDCWEATLVHDGEPHWNGDDPTEMYARGLQMALAYVEVVVPTIAPLAVEQRVEINLPGIPTLVGRVDVIEREKIRERKTTAQKQTSPKARWRFQARIYQLMVGLPVEWDVITRQVATKIYQADEHPELRMELVDPEVTTGMIRSLWRTINDCHARYGPDGTWPLLGQWGDWSCNFCSHGPRHQGDCPAWR